ncbi:hypothetical protein QAD02_024247 [Eretmocerus hayati]|uniref:Uncharacterized protein n=1 Tax=Eretmocerus hayati TaxID=131215 RepID=A0ACC2Q1L2_9HYME|nr:hypothetical protein QAD02_024247 [Eretmocerus hayati]
MCSLKFSLVTVLLLVFQDQTLGQLLTSSDSQEGGLFGSSNEADFSSGDARSGSAEANGYLPPIGSQGSDDVPSFAKPPKEDDRSSEDNQPSANQPVFRQVGCAAALICVEEQYCTMTGMISKTPLSLTEAQKSRQVPMVDCRNPDNGVEGKCCRDPDYVDPWPAGGLLPVNYTGGFDEKGFPSYLNLSKKKPTQPSKPGQPQPQRPQAPLNLIPFPQQPAGPLVRPQQPPRPVVPQQSFPQGIDSSEANFGQPTFESQRIVPGQQPRPLPQSPNTIPDGSVQFGQGQQFGVPQKPRPFQPAQFPQQPQQPFNQPSTVQPLPSIRPSYPSSTAQPSNYNQDIEQPGQVILQPGQPIVSNYPSSTPQPPSYVQQSGQPSTRPSYPSSTQQPPSVSYPSSTPQNVDIEQPGQVVIQPQQPQRPGYPSSTQPPRYEVNYPGPNQQVIIGQRPQPGKTYEVATYPEVPNQIPGLSPPNRPYEDSREIQGPAGAPVVPQGTSPRPGIFSGPTSPPYQHPKFPLPAVPNPNAFQVSIAPHTPGSRCGIINQVQYPGNLRQSEVAFGEIPWEAMILLNSEKRLLCSGAIVAPNLVLTAANCVYGINPADISIKAGEYKLGYELKHEEPYPFQIVQVASIAPHPNYQPGSAGYDTALLYLEHPIKLDQHIDILCVSSEAPVVTPGRRCISVGWGKEILKLHAAGAVQNKIEVDILREDQCAQRLTGAETQLELHESLVCGKPHRQSNNMCMVDLGGPLACQREDGTYELVAVYSQDTGCMPTNQVATFALIDADWGDDQQQPTKTNQIQYPGSVPAGLNQYLPPV